MRNRQAKSKIFHYDFMKKNRRGFLLAEETLKIVIAVIAIGFLVYFLASLYLKNQNNKDLELAKATLEKIISDAEFGEVEIYNPTSLNLVPPYSGWILISFPFDSSGLPKKCSNFNWDNCLCICYKEKNTIKDSGFAVDCDDEGKCVQSDLVVNDEVIKLENPPVKLLIKDKVISK